MSRERQMRDRSPSSLLTIPKRPEVQRASTETQSGFRSAWRPFAALGAVSYLSRPVTEAHRAMLHRQTVAAELAHELRRVARAIMGAAVWTGADWSEHDRGYTKRLANELLRECDADPAPPSDLRPITPRGRGGPPLRMRDSLFAPQSQALRRWS
jgi:hypothetical protein